ncbi:hypothetical protein BH23THE1_BH23THE1_31050 [soil metagenome]
MSSNQNPPYHSGYKSAADWANNYAQNSNSKKDNGITIFWIATVVLLLIVAGWWWWKNYRSNIPEKSSSPMQDLKNGANNSTSKITIKPDGTVVNS